MKCKIPEISWHNRDPVLSVDLQPKSGNDGSSYRLASGGTDSHVLIWYVSSAEKGSELLLDVAADLTRHQRAVNVVKWSPSGELLASGDDESVIFIWKQKADSEPINILDTACDQDKEIWITLKVLRGHMEDVYDLSWCPNSMFLVSGSVDNSAIIWDVHKGKSQAILNDHKGFVQGVAWDPKNQYIATLSTDRYLRVFDIQTKKVLHRVSKSSLPVPEGNELHGKRMRIYHDDTLQTFFRRLCFTPDGKLLITPAGVTDYEGVTHPLHTSYIYSRYSLKQPAIVLPCPDQYTVAIKCCPLLFKLKPHDINANPPVVPLPYRMIFAIATRSSVYLYDTQQQQPFGLISNIHYTRLTDITWSSDGCIIVVSSTDGFCSLIIFEPGELGEEYEESAAILAKMIEENPVKEKKSKKNKENLTGSRKCSMDENTKSETSIKPLETVQEQKPNNEKPKSTPIPVISTEHDSKISGPQESEVQNESTVNQFQEKEQERKPNSDIPESTTSPVKSEGQDREISDPQESEVQKESTSIQFQEKEAVPIHAKIILNESIPADIIIDKEILSSDEKFESPEKKSRPATPISVRRHPRTPSNTFNSTPSSSVDVVKSKPSVEKSPLSSLGLVSSPRQTKRATPIAVRRAPRAIITAPTPIEKTALLDEALDAWPLGNEPIETENREVSHKNVDIEIAPTNYITAATIDTTSERTEDMRLVYEDTQEETTKKGDSAMETFTKSAALESSLAVTSEPKTPKQLQITTANNKTPRRVALTTISTPKSKKKLLE